MLCLCGLSGRTLVLSQHRRTQVETQNVHSEHEGRCCVCAARLAGFRLHLTTCTVKKRSNIVFVWPVRLDSGSVSAQTQVETQNVHQNCGVLCNPSVVNKNGNPTRRARQTQCINVGAESEGTRQRSAKALGCTVQLVSACRVHRIIEKACAAKSRIT